MASHVSTCLHVGHMVSHVSTCLHVGHMASHVSTCMHFGRSQPVRRSRERKGKKRKRRKKRKGDRKREKRKSAFQRSKLVGLRSKVCIFDEGYAPRGRDSFYFGLFPTLRAVWLCFCPKGLFGQILKYGNVALF